MAEIEQLSQHRCFGGVQGYYRHESQSTGTAMNFSVYLPARSEVQKLSALYYLAGLTCTEETFMIKAGAQRVASELGLVLVTCDTSPRGLDLPGDSDHWDFGVGAGFYINASRSPWSSNYRMAEYVNTELPTTVEQHFPVRDDMRAISGHSMGGHGALITALRDPCRWHSVSAFSPIANPTAVPWGRKAFSNYLGEDESLWAEWDASCLLAKKAYPGEILVDQGLNDEFLVRELHPEALEMAARTSGQLLRLRRHEGYNHGYYFIQSFIEEHLQHHARNLGTS